MGGKRLRLDEALVIQNLAETRARARALVMAGDVLVDGEVSRVAGKPVRPEQTLALRERQRFVSRGGEKLDHALDEFSIDVVDAVCADFGASTGGFTDCLLLRNARKVYAIDVGYGQLHSKIRDDTRVVVMERVNVRLLAELPEPVDGVVIDVSFISLRLVLPVAAKILKSGGWCVPLIKPQFEAGRGQVGKGGVVRDPTVHEQVIREVMNASIPLALMPQAITTSPITGPAGNVEFLAALIKDGSTSMSVDDLVASLEFGHAAV